MPQHEIQYLQEMGIQCYELTHPERLQGYQSPTLVLQASCQLLLISPQCPKKETALLFERVLKSLKLELNQSLHIYPEQLDQLSEPFTGWVWFAGCDVPIDYEGKVLTTPLIHLIDGNNELRRALWQQISSYQ